MGNEERGKTATANFTMGKGRNVPHIKTYYQVRPGAGGQDQESMEWFVLSSHNLSKAAWGEMQNGSRGETFKVLNWELGVFVSPKTLGVNRLVPHRRRRRKSLFFQRTREEGGGDTAPISVSLRPLRTGGGSRGRSTSQPDGFFPRIDASTH